MLWSLRNPISIQINKLPGTFDHLLGIEFRKSELHMASIHPIIVLINSKHINLLWIIFLFIGLRTLETLNTVMQCCIRWIQFKLLKRLYFWLLPSTILAIIVADQHMISKNAPKNILMVFIRSCLLVLRLFNNQVIGLYSEQI